MLCVDIQNACILCKRQHCGSSKKNAAGNDKIGRYNTKMATTTDINNDDKIREECKLVSSGRSVRRTPRWNEVACTVEFSLAKSIQSVYLFTGRWYETVCDRSTACGKWRHKWPPLTSIVWWYIGGRMSEPCNWKKGTGKQKAELNANRLHHWRLYTHNGNHKMSM